MLLSRILTSSSCVRTVIRPSRSRRTSRSIQSAGRSTHVPAFKWYGWGSSDHGQFGLGEKFMVEPSPIELKAINDLHLDQLSVGMNVCVGKSSLNNLVYCWGENHGDMIATDVRGDLPSPIPCSHADNAFAGWDCIWLVGGDKDQVTRWGPPNGFAYTEDAKSREIQQIVSSAYHSAILKTSGEVIFRKDRDDAEDHTPFPIIPPVTAITKGWSHFLLLDDVGAVWAIGANKHGQCGVGTTSYLHSPAKAEILPGHKVTRIASGATHSLALTDKGQLFCWGSFKDGKLGIITDRDQIEPVEIEFFRDKEVTLIAAGCDHSVVVTKQGDIYTWGFGQHGALGTGELLDSPLPVKVKKFHDGEIVDVQCGMDVTFVKTIARL